MKRILFSILACALVIASSGCMPAPCEGPHNEVIDEAVAPTCTKTGLTEGKHCADCKTVTVKQKVVPTAHDYVDEIVQPSMLAGKYAEVKCKLCGYKIDEKFSFGFEIVKDDENMTCSIKSKGECNDKEINIPPVISGYKVTAIAKRAFSGERKITSVKVPDGVTTVGDYAFSNCSRLVNVDLPESVMAIGTQAFSYSSRLKLVVIPEGVTAIKTATFFSCGALESVVIPATMKSISTQAFASANLKKIFYGGTAEQWDGIKLEYGNGEITPAVRYYYSEEKPSVSNVYWHFVDGVPTVW